MGMFYPIVISMTLSLVSVLIISIRKRNTALLIITALATALLSPLMFWLVPTHMMNADTTVKLSVDTLVPLPDGDPDLTEIEAWIRLDGDELIAYAANDDAPPSERRVSAPNTLVTYTAIATWETIDTWDASPRRPRLTTVSCRYTQPLMQWLIGSCTPDRRWVLIIPAYEPENGLADILPGYSPSWE